MANVKVSKKEAADNCQDKWYWLAASVLLLAGIAGNVFFQAMAFPIRLALDLILICLVIAVLMPTRLAGVCQGYVQQAWMELRRVTWPSYHEARSATIMVVVVVVAVSLLLWVLDSILIHIVKLFV
jgi:preprotein translocase subunit SecE